MSSTPAPSTRCRSRCRLDVFYAPTVTAQEGAGLRALGTRVGDLAGGLIDFACGRFATDPATIGDAGAVAILLAPEAVRLQRLPVRVELSGTWTRGGPSWTSGTGQATWSTIRTVRRRPSSTSRSSSTAPRSPPCGCGPCEASSDGPRPGPRFTQCRPRDERRAAPRPGETVLGMACPGWPAAGRQPGRGPGPLVSRSRWSAAWERMPAARHTENAWRVGNRRRSRADGVG